MTLSLLAFFVLFPSPSAPAAEKMNTSLVAGEHSFFVDDDVVALAAPLADPLEPLNRVFFQFNDSFYFCILKPASQMYGSLVPDMLRLGVRNFFSNLLSPVRIVNNVLQWKWKNVELESVRFFVNSTIGLLGFMDPAEEEMNIPPQPEDFGQTLGVLGFGPGIYIHWPFLGASSVRDSFGYWVDTFFSPLWYLYRSDPGVWLEATALYQVNNTTFTGQDYEDFKEISFDPYLAVRDAYEQSRRTSILDRHSPDSPAVGQGFVK